MAMFNSYVKLPEGISLFNPCGVVPCPTESRQGSMTRQENLPSTVKEKSFANPGRFWEEFIGYILTMWRLPKHCWVYYILIGVCIYIILYTIITIIIIIIIIRIRIRRRRRRRRITIKNNKIITIIINEYWNNVCIYNNKQNNSNNNNNNNYNNYYYHYYYHYYYNYYYIYMCVCVFVSYFFLRTDARCW